MKTQDRTIREKVKLFIKHKRLSGIAISNELKYLFDLFEQPEKQEIDVSHEVTADMADFNDVVYNRDCIIELQETVNKLLKEE